jgi:hypothetical protein
MAVRSEIARKMDPPFDPTLGHRGARTMGHEEVLFLECVRAHSLLVYQPQARVVHRVLPERMALDAVRRSFFRGGFGLARAERLLGEPTLSLPRRLVRAARTCRGAWMTRSRNKNASHVGPQEALAECAGFMWAGKHLEMLFGRFPRLTDWMAEHLV